MIERISSFRMVRTVSEGEKNALLHAVSEKSGERVAVRLFRGSSATEEMEKRSQRAVRITQLLAHPAVVRIIQAGRLPDGSVYQIQEQLAGETLANRLSSRPRLPQNELLRLGRQIATVLAAAHARGVVHRVLRPESLQLVPDPEAVGGERVKITDWGLAQLPTTSDSELAELPPIPLDEPTYLAPEQCRAGAAAPELVPGPVAPAEAAAVADRIDVYALGVLLFQMATGQAPFGGRAASEVIALHIAALPPKLADKGVTTPPELPPLVAAMLIKDPTARPTMQEVESRLQQLASQQQLAKTMLPPSRAASAPLPPMQPNANVTVQMRVGSDAPPRPQRRPPRWQWAAGLAGGLLVAGTLWGLLGRRTEPIHPPTPSATAGETPAAKPSTPDESAARNPTANPSAANSGAAKPGAASPDTAQPGAANPDTVNPGAASDRIAAASPSREEPVAAAAPPTAPSAQAAADSDAPRPASAPLVAGSAAALATLGAHPGAVPPGSEAAAAAAAAEPKSADATPSPDSADRAQSLLLNAQSAFDRGDYPQTIALANEAKSQYPLQAAQLLGKAACTLSDLALVGSSYASLRKSPAQLNVVLAECRKYGIVLGAHGQFVHKAH